MHKRLCKGEDHPELARSLVNLAALYHVQGKLGDAEPLSKDALDMRTSGLFKGQDHPHLASSLNNLANAMYWDQGKLADAEPLYKEALDMNQEACSKGQDHPFDLAGTLEQPGGPVLMDSGQTCPGTPSRSSRTPWRCVSGCSRARTTPTSPPA